MRVLHVIARLNVGGTARYITRLAQEMPLRGVETFVATGFVQGLEVEDPSANEIDLLRLPSLGRAISPMKDLKARQEFLKIIADVKPDVVHTHTFKAGAIGRTSIDKTKKAAGKDVKFVHTFHGHLLDDPEFSGIKSKAILTLERRLAKSTDALITVGKKVGKELLDQKVGRTGQYVSIAPGVDPLDITDRSRAFANLGLHDDSRSVVGWIARVTGVKNPMRALEIARLMPDVRFVIAGGGDLLEQVRANAPENTSVIGWSDARDLLGISDLILSTSENEGMPVALIEAQLAGKPVVATDVGSVSEVVLDSKTGFVTSENVNDLANAVEKLVNSIELRTEFGSAAVRHATTDFSVEKMINAHLNLYKSLAELN